MLNVTRTTTYVMVFGAYTARGCVTESGIVEMALMKGIVV
jgi:hypothetical protein